MVVRQLKVAAVLVILCSLIFSYSVASSLPQKFTVKPVPDQKIQTVKKPLKAKIVSGYCCLEGVLSLMQEKQCSVKRGTYFTDKAEAKKNCGFCCIKGNVEPLQLKKCQAKRGTFFVSKEEAKKKCTGYCCRDDKVSKVARSQCSNKGDQFYGSRAEADKQCTGWCCSEGKVERLNSADCKARKGAFFATEIRAKRNCKAARGFCNIDGRTVRLNEKECRVKKGSWFKAQSLAKNDLLKLKRSHPDFELSTTNTPKIDPGPKVSFLPDLVVQKIYLDNKCRIHMVVKNQGAGRISDEDYQNSQFGLSSWVPDDSYTPIVEASLTISDPLPMTQLDPGGILKNPGGSLDFNSKLVLQQEANIYGVVDAPYGHFFEGRIAETNNINNGLWNRNVRCHKP